MRLHARSCAVMRRHARSCAVMRHHGWSCAVMHHQRPRQVFGAKLAKFLGILSFGRSLYSRKMFSCMHRVHRDPKSRPAGSRNQRHSETLGSRDTDPLALHFSQAPGRGDSETHMIGCGISQLQAMRWSFNLTDMENRKEIPVLHPSAYVSLHNK